MVLYNAQQTAIWTSQTEGKGNSGQVELVVQNDTNLVLYLYEDGGKRALWSPDVWKLNTPCPDPSRL